MANPKNGQVPKVQRGGDGEMQISNGGHTAQDVFAVAESVGALADWVSVWLAGGVRMHGVPEA
jgi:hypothetical protein